MLKESLKKLFPSQILIFYKYLYSKISSIKFFLSKRGKIHRYCGYLLNIYIHDEVSKSWYDHDWIRSEIKFLKQGKLMKGAHVFEIGAHHGVVALIFSKIVGKKGHVIAVEMDRMHSKIAEINIHNNMAKNITLINAAVGESNNSTVNYSNDQIKRTKDKNISEKINLITIDSLSKKYGYPSVIYIDVEGYECNVLNGAQETLKTQPDFCIEVHANNGLENFKGSINSLISNFNSNKYLLYMSPANDECDFVKFSPMSQIPNDRFYLIALSKK